MRIGLLSGRRIVVTRQASRASGAVSAIEAEGGNPILLPTLAIDRAGDFPEFDAALREISNYDYVVVTSANTAFALVEGLRASGASLASPTWKCVAIGRATAAALGEGGMAVAIMPAEAVSERIAESMGELRGKRVLIPGSDLARGVVGEALRKRGAMVDEVLAYRTRLGEGSEGALAEIDRGVDAILFTSPSGARNFATIAGGAPRAGRALIACIGPVTAEAVSALGFKVGLVAEDHSMEGLLRALVEYWRVASDAEAEDGRN